MYSLFYAQIVYFYYKIVLKWTKVINNPVYSLKCINNWVINYINFIIRENESALECFTNSFETVEELSK